MKKYNSPYEWRVQKDISRQKLMTDDEMRRVDDYITQITHNKGDMGSKFSEWDDIEEAYKNDQPKIDKRPNSRINIINSNIEGQIASILEQNIAVTTKPEGPSDKSFSEWARIGLDWTLRKNKIKRIIDMHERRRLKFGIGWMKVYFDEKAVNGFGLSKISPAPLNKVFIDKKVKDYLRYQEAEYICETITQSRQWAIEMYGEEKARAIDYGNIEYRDNGVFIEDFTDDDEDSFTLIQRWSRYNDMLRLEEFSGCGVLLYDSHKEGERSDNQRGKKYDHKPYYKYVDSRYPYFLTIMYPEEGSLYGFGDGKLLLPLQNMINELYDKIRICARPNLTLIDVNSEVDVEDFDENSFEPRPFDGQQTGAPVVSVPWGQVNDSWWKLLEKIQQEAQRVTRFSDLMIGQAKAADTATEASIQQQQGNASSDQKKGMLELTLVEVCEYCLGLMMQFYTEAKAFRISEEDDKYMWIDFRQLASVPVMKPATEGYKKKFRDNNPNAGPPEWELITNEKGQPVTKNIDLDIEISIGAGLPKNKTFLWQMIEKLSQIAIPDQNGQVRPGISWEEFRTFCEDMLGLPLDDMSEMKQMFAQQQQMMMQQAQQMPMQNANAPLSAGGSPMMSMLPGGGMIGNNPGA